MDSRPRLGPPFGDLPHVRLPFDLDPPAHRRGDGGRIIHFSSTRSVAGGAQVEGNCAVAGIIEGVLVPPI